jgi:sporulation protein YlmC with PRC-barrel domain
MLDLLLRLRAKERTMKTRSRKWNGLIVAAVMIMGGGIAAAEQAQAPVVGAQPIGVSVQEEAIVAKGWSSKKDLVGKSVYNDKNEKIGTIDDVILSPDRTASFAVVGTGGFVGLAKHDVAIPFQQLQLNGTRILLPGATKDAIRSLPEFVYAR